MPSITTRFTAYRESLLRTSYTGGTLWRWRNVGNAAILDGSLATYSGTYLGQVVNANNSPISTAIIGSFPVLNIPAGSFVRGFELRIRKIATSSAPSTILVKDHVIQLGMVNPATGILTLGPVNKSTFTPWLSSLSDSVYGGPNDTWAINATLLNSNQIPNLTVYYVLNFGYNDPNGFTANPSAFTIGIDAFEITIHYSTGAISPPGIESRVTIPTHLVKGRTNVNLIGVNPPPVPSPNINPQARLNTGGIASRLIIPNPITKASTSVNPTGIISSLILPTHIVRLGFSTLSPSGILSSLIIPNPRLNGLTNILPSGLTSQLLLGNNNVYALSKILLSGINSELNLGNILIKSVANIFPSGQDISSPTSTPTAKGTLSILPNGVISSFLLSNPSLFAQSKILPNGQLSIEGFTSPLLVATHKIFPTGFDYSRALTNPNIFAAAKILPGSIVLPPGSNISSMPFFGYNPSFSQPNFIYVNSSNPALDNYYPLKTASTVGNHRFTGATSVSPGGLASRVDLSNHTIYGRVIIYPSGISTKLDIVNPTTKGFTSVYINSIESQLKINRHFIHSIVNIVPTGLDSKLYIPNHILTQRKNIIPAPITDNNIIPNPFLIYNKIIYPPFIFVDGLGRHKVIRRTIRDFYSQMFTPAYEVGYYNIFAMSRTLDYDPDYTLDISELNTNYQFAINNINLSYGDKADYNQRLAGEGASPSTFMVSNRDYSLSFSLPLRIESLGHLDFVFSALFDYSIQGYKGSTLSILSRLKSTNGVTINPGTTEIFINNISDFMDLSFPIAAKIKSDGTEATENIIITGANKTLKKITLQSATTLSHTTSSSYISVIPTSNSREGTFSIFTLREGLLSGCIVDKISITFKPGESIMANVTLRFLDMNRKYQIDMLSNFNDFVANVVKRKPTQVINGSQIRLNKTSPSYTYNFGLGQAVSSKMFYGYQERDFSNLIVNEFTLEINNNLKPVYTMNAQSTTELDLNKNRNPYAYVSEGRSISGTITYTSPMKPWLFAEVLTGPSGINNGGLIIDLGPASIELPDIVYHAESSTSSVTENHQKKISWSVVTPELNFEALIKPN